MLLLKVYRYALSDRILRFSPRRKRIAPDNHTSAWSARQGASSERRSVNGMRKEILHNDVLSQFLSLGGRGIPTHAREVDSALSGIRKDDAKIRRSQDRWRKGVLIPHRQTSQGIRLQAHCHRAEFSTKKYGHSHFPAKFRWVATTSTVRGLGYLLWPITGYLWQVSQVFWLLKCLWFEMKGLKMMSIFVKFEPVVWPEAFCSASDILLVYYL